MKPRWILLATAAFLLIQTVRGVVAVPKPEYPCSFRNPQGALIPLSDAKQAREKAARLGEPIGVRLNDVTEHTVEATIRCVTKAYGMAAGPLLTLAECESHGDPQAVSPSGKYHSIFQYDEPTWAAASATYGHKGADIHSGYAQINTTVQKVKAEGGGAWPYCGPKAGL